MKAHLIATLAPAVFLTLAACEGALPAPEQSVSLPPVAIRVEGTNLYTGNTGAPLSQQLVVRVINARGEGVPGITVTWEVVEGGGRFLNGYRTDTDAEGLTRAQFEPYLPGALDIRANAPGLEGSPAHFTVNAFGNPLVIVPFGPVFDVGCYPLAYSRFQVPQGSVPVLTTVEFVYEESGCTARIVSTAVPDGGTSFDSGVLYPGQTYRFVFNVAGDWLFQDTINGGVGKLTVR